METYHQMQVVYTNECVVMGTVYCWVKKHKWNVPGRADLCKQEQSEWPVTATGKFAGESLMNSLTTISRSLKQKLLPSGGISQEYVGYVLQCQKIVLVGFLAC